MPRENRKRGKKHRKRPEQALEQQVNFEHGEQPEPIVESLDQPSWIISGPKEEEEENPEVPYGYVDADVKAYFRTVDAQIRDWHEGTAEAGDTDPNESMLFY